MSEYSFRLSDKSDKQLITKFMDEHWGSAHPLIHNKKFFKHYYESRDELQFALCCKGDKLVSVCGYIYANSSENPDIWVSIWLAIKGENGAGLQLMSSIPSLTNARIMSCNNIRANTMPFYTFLGYTADRIPHYYRLNDKSEYTVCKIKNKKLVPVCGEKTLNKLCNESELFKIFVPNTARKPYKDIWYIVRRYFNYPHQSYDVWRLEQNGMTDALLITRTVNVDGTNVLRIVDFTGKPNSFTQWGYGIEKLMQEVKAEYCDIYCYGISREIMLKTGFCERFEDDENIIPNYLNPPLYENTDYYFFTSDAENFTMFKADGDQDRPNI